MTICVEKNSADMHQLAFEFSLKSKARQFHINIFLFPETILAMRSPAIIQQAIADSRFCDCGFTTKHSCDRLCQGLKS